MPSSKQGECIQEVINDLYMYLHAAKTVILNGTEKQLSCILFHRV